MQEAFEKARMNMDATAATRQKRLNKKAVDTTIPIEARVLVRNRVQGRNKIQDFWKGEPYQVTGRPDPAGNVYTVTPLVGDGASENRNRRDLLHVSQSFGRENPREPVRRRATKLNIVNLPSSSGEETNVYRIRETTRQPRAVSGDSESYEKTQDMNKTGKPLSGADPPKTMDSVVSSTEESDQERRDRSSEEVTDNDESSDDIESGKTRSTRNLVHNSRYETSSSQEEFKPRRSRMKTAGTHTNPHHLPGSSISNVVQAHAQQCSQNMSAVDLSEAILQLGSSRAQGLGQSVGHVLRESWSKQG